MGSGPGLKAVALGSCASCNVHTHAQLKMHPSHSPLPPSPTPRLLASGSQELLIAACTGDVERLQEVEGEGEGPNALVFLHDWTVLHEACQWGQVGVVQELLQQGGVNLCKQV